MGKYQTHLGAKRIQVLVLLLVLLIFPQSALSDGQGTIPEVSLARQIIVVVTKDWQSPSGIMYRYQRKADGDPWEFVSGPWPTMIGMNGLAWGYGVHPRPTEAKALFAVEGDDRSPAGIFRLFQQFGFQKPEQMASNALPFVEVNNSVECVDDPKSRFYNQIVDRSTVKADWKSSEAMRNYDSYERGIDFSHNHDPITAGLGSCVFLHEWGGPGAATRGCTVVEKSQVKELAEWLRSDAKPLIVQLPEEEYRRFEKSWGLPSLNSGPQTLISVKTP